METLYVWRCCFLLILNSIPTVSACSSSITLMLNTEPQGKRIHKNLQRHLFKTVPWSYIRPRHSLTHGCTHTRQTGISCHLWVKSAVIPALLPVWSIHPFIFSLCIHYWKKNRLSHRVNTTNLSWPTLWSPVLSICLHCTTHPPLPNLSTSQSHFPHPSLHSFTLSISHSLSLPHSFSSLPLLLSHILSLVCLLSSLTLKRSESGTTQVQVWHTHTGVYQCKSRKRETECVLLALWRKTASQPNSSLIQFSSIHPM